MKNNRKPKQVDPPVSLIGPDRGYKWAQFRSKSRSEKAKGSAGPERGPSLARSGIAGKLEFKANNPMPSKPVGVAGVFICSRMEEMSESRRAAFNAAIDEGFTPIMYEALYFSRQEKSQNRILDARQRVDHLLDRSDYLVLLVGDSLGLPFAEFCEMQASLFEFYWFILKWKLIDVDGLNPAEAAKELRQTFPKAALDDDQRAEIRCLRAEVDSQLRQFMFVLGNSSLEGGGEAEMDHLDPRVLEELPFARVFRDRIFIAQRWLGEGRAMDTTVQNFLHSKPARAYKGSQVGPQEITESGVTFLSPQHQLYQLVCKWLSEREQTSMIATPGETVYAVLASAPRRGYLHELTESLYLGDWNVERLRIVGRPKAIPKQAAEARLWERCFPSTYDRFLLVEAVPSRSSMDVRDAAGERRQFEKLVARTAPNPQFIECGQFNRLFGKRWTPGPMKTRGIPGSLATFLLTVADIPGMLLRVFTAISRSGARIVSLEYEGKHPSIQPHRNRRAIGVELLEQEGLFTNDSTRRLLELQHILSSRFGVLECYRKE